MTTKATETGLTIYQGERYVITTDKGREVAALLMGSLAPGETMDVLDLPVIKVPSGGGRAWDLGGGEVATEFEGVLILRQPVRAYWRDSFASTGGGTPPDCASADSITGVGEPGGDCAQCGLSMFGTATGDDGSAKQGQACRQITRLFVMRPQMPLPIIVSLPPSSYKAAKEYVINTVAQHQRHYATVVTRFSLEPAQSRDGIKFSRVHLEVASLLPEKEAEQFAAYRDGMTGALRGLPITDNEII